ncbi:hypothetical protein GALMADRAFT_105493 [Galerina marginata CBS 339.88]|uniref:Nephrocystin 3-like N-terminal domain-containing protein n=1 Tax=Galerina marginata (strain CBS 339.88) TaxID=685588 RepID=A0A067SCY8_GALM3|nr:hypothetical protein GALMADRAFT_105493 [Galerina marginata CBS 339.88]
MSTAQSVGAKLKSKLLNREIKDRLAAASKTAIDGLWIFLKLFEGAAGSVGVPGLSAGVKGVLFVIEVVRKTSQNVDDLEDLAKRIIELTTMVEDWKKARVSDGMQDRIERLLKKWAEIESQVRVLHLRSRLERVVHHLDDVEVIGGLVRAISQSIESFNGETLHAIEVSVNKLGQITKDGFVQLGTKVDTGIGQVINKLEQQTNARDGHLTAYSAVFECLDTQKVSQCLQGTRVDILKQLISWIGLEENTDHSSTELDTSVFWINGAAGTGKTTLAYTIAAACRANGKLGASFFCSRDTAERSNIQLIFPTIADQLGRLSRLYQVILRKTIQLNPHIGSASPLFQLEKLIVKPLLSIGKYFPSYIIILDALDECKDTGAISIILSSLSYFIKDLPLKFLITSRPDLKITSVFNSKSSKLAFAAQKLVLHEIALATVEPDISHYIHFNLHKIEDYYQLDSPLASEADIQALTKQAYGLFIFAATSVKFIADESYSDPPGQLETLLQGSKDNKVSSSNHHHLDNLYIQVFTSAFPKMKDSLVARLKLILGTIVLLQDPLSTVSIEHLLNLRQSTVRQILRHLHSIILVPENITEPIRLLHPSFADFIIDSKRCNIENFQVNSIEQHTLLAKACLKSMQNLKKDICQIGNPSLLNSEVNNLSSQIKECIPSYLQYACKHWAFHFVNSRASGVLFDLIKEFCNKYMLYWIEVCSLIGDLKGALLAVNLVRGILFLLVSCC